MAADLQAVVEAFAALGQALATGGVTSVNAHVLYSGRIIIGIACDQSEDAAASIARALGLPASRAVVCEDAVLGGGKRWTEYSGMFDEREVRVTGPFVRVEPVAVDEQLVDAALAQAQSVIAGASS